jgi:signal transduction histidine kinase
MAKALTRFVPRRWLERSARSARLRLTLMYSGMFLVLGSAVIAIIFVLVWTGQALEQSTSQAVSPLPGPAPLFHSGAAQQHSADVARLLAVSWLALAVTAAASAVLGWFAAGRVLRPLREMTAGARKITAGNLHQRLALDGPDDEFKQLADTVDDLLARLETSFAAQRRFVANAAHELRTPLTLERTLLQVALADPDASATTLRATCEELLAAGRSQERLLNALLTLASSDRGLDRHEPVDLHTLVDRAVESIRAEIDQQRLELTTRLLPATAHGDPALLECLVGNLVENAVRYNRTDGQLVINTSGGPDGTTLSVANTGAQIDAAEVERLFEPFQRLEQERTGSADHHGLGLSIVQAIAAAHDATVSAQPGADGGLRVTVSFSASV